MVFCRSAACASSESRACLAELQSCSSSISSDLTCFLSCKCKACLSLAFVFADTRWSPRSVVLFKFGHTEDFTCSRATACCFVSFISLSSAW